MWAEYIRDSAVKTSKLQRKMDEKGEKPEVLEAVLKETVDLVIDLNKLFAFACYYVGVVPLCSVSKTCECRKIYPLRRFLII